MNTEIILAGLKAHPVRTAVGVLAVTLEVVLILMLVGLTNGSLSDTGNRVAGVGGEIIFKNMDSSYFLGMSNTILPLKLARDIAMMEGIKAVAPVVTQIEQSGGLTMVWGIDPPSFDAMSGGFRFLSGRIFSTPDEAVIDDRIARDRKLTVGSQFEVLSRMFTISGVVESGKGARIFIPIGTAQEMTNRPDSASVFYIKLNDKSQTKEIIERLKMTPRVGEGRDIIDADEWLSLMYASNSALLGAVFNMIVLLGVSIGVLVIFLSMYTTVTERTREIGILRAMGASKGFIVLLVIQESLVLCLIGAGVGIGSSFLLMVVLKKVLPTLNILITSEWILRASVFALLSGVIGSLYPAYKAASQDPIEALAYE
jgi:putative ABC transport system permease protein